MNTLTQQQMEQLILAHYPEQTDYWLHPGGGKHTPITLNLKCPRCGHEETATIKNKTELKRMLKKECAGCEARETAQNQHLNIPMPFGKHCRETVNAVMAKDPTYLAWFVDQIKGQDALIEQIKTHTQFPEAWAEYTGKQATRFPRIYREEKEWQAGRFSQQTIDDLFNCFFGEANDASP